MPEQPCRQDLFRQQWVRWQPRIYAYIRAIVFNRSDAEDLLQEVAEVLWRKIDAYEPATQFDHWAFGVARNKVLNFQKKKGRDRARFSETLEEVLAEEAARPSRKGDLLDALESCVDKLPAQLRDLLRRRYEPQATNRSVAHDLGRSESVISRTLNKAYGLLLECMDAGDSTAAPRLSTENSP
ncbi:MAG: sigma-70 family RNA polymerase sigma factor [Planctomycetes bacterium]|nr:sigma-70 family RNA polymerase sigma factor [Planctomycetota bacterium]